MVGRIDLGGEATIAFPTLLDASITKFDDAVIYIHKAEDNGGAATSKFKAYTAEDILALRGGVCGDGSVDTGEECDDGNTDAGDGCSATCTVEDGYTCSGEPSVCTELTAGECGDGVLNTGEGCDDGNVDAGDGCSATCTVEEGFTCTGQPSTCVESVGPDAEKGATTYGSKCEGCHGADAVGNIGPALTAPMDETVIRNGVSGTSMPAFTTEQLSDSDIADIDAWLETLGGGDGGGNATNGAALYTSGCSDSSCHGVDGSGNGGVQGLDASAIETACSSLAFMSCSGLSASDFADLEAYLQTL